MYLVLIIFIFTGNINNQKIFEAYKFSIYFRHYILVVFSSWQVGRILFLLAENITVIKILLNIYVSIRRNAPFTL